MSKRAAKEKDIEKSNRKNLKEEKLKNSVSLQSQKVGSRVKLMGNGDVNKTWENIRQDIKISTQRRIGCC